ncbi:MAG TPA: bifunctional 2-polyprenyl-6-hydroxyphenol methylase/3-demethylubiquinol 3-O-methyltransferase UbiG, partial [Nevskiaceae bacterium]
MEPNVDAGEIRHFDALAERWWDDRGPMATLHDINPVRLSYLRNRVGDLAGLRVLDVGCGGGILSEALAEAGARVTGIDLAADSIKVARRHAADHKVEVEYLEQSAEALAAERPRCFDLVCCMELLEHVPDPAAIVGACATLARADGHVVFSTINRTLLAWALMIPAAEGLLRL